MLNPRKHTPLGNPLRSHTLPRKDMYVAYYSDFFRLFK